MFGSQNMAMGQNLRSFLGMRNPPFYSQLLYILLGVHSGTGVLTHFAVRPMLEAQTAAGTFCLGKRLPTWAPKAPWKHRC